MLSTRHKQLVSDRCLPGHTRSWIAQPTTEDFVSNSRQQRRWHAIAALLIGLTLSGEPASAVEPQTTPHPVAKEPAGKEPEAAPAAPATKALFDGKTLKNWKVTGFGGEGAVAVKDGVIIMEQGSEITGIHWAGEPLPKLNYELSWEAQRIEGTDFFSGVVFTVRDSACSFVAGGWGGSVTGLSAVDGLYAADNDTASFQSYQDGKWYAFRLRVGEKFIKVWLDGKPVIDLDMTDRKLSVHPAVELSKPLGFSCFSTKAGLRNIRLRALTADEAAGKEATANPPAKAAP